jgi:hypothetical protein
MITYEIMEIQKDHVYSCTTCGLLTLNLNRHSAWHKDAGEYTLLLREDA